MYIVHKLKYRGSVKIFYDRHRQREREREREKEVFGSHWTIADGDFGKRGHTIGWLALSALYTLCHTLKDWETRG